MTEYAVLRADVWDASDKHCAYCGIELHPLRNFCIDHVTPKCAGGTDDMSNLVASCRMCNNQKGSTTDRELCMRIKASRPRMSNNPLLDIELVKRERQKRGWSQNQLAKHAGVSHTVIRLAEAGGRCQLRTANKISKALGVHDVRLGYGRKS